MLSKTWYHVWHVSRYGTDAPDADLKMDPAQLGASFERALLANTNRGGNQNTIEHPSSVKRIRSDTFLFFFGVGLRECWTQLLCGECSSFHFSCRVATRTRPPGCA